MNFLKLSDFLKNKIKLYLIRGFYISFFTSLNLKSFALVVRNTKLFHLPLGLLDQSHMPVHDLRSKAWDEFAVPDAPSLDFVFTVCDNAAGEVCPIWPGHPATAHWSYADPSEAPGSEAQKREAFRQTLLAIHRRLELFINLPTAALERLALQTSARGLAGR